MAEWKSERDLASSLPCLPIYLQAQVDLVEVRVKGVNWLSQNMKQAESDLEESSPPADIVSAKDSNPKYQENNVTIEKPYWSTTIVINNQSDNTARLSSIVNATTNSQPPLDIAQGAHQSPVRPVIKLPTTLIGSKKRSFKSDWYSKYRWLEYSVQNNVAYCYACRLFSVAVLVGLRKRLHR